MDQAEPYIGLLIQIPLVGIFVWFSLRLIDQFLKALDARDVQWRQFIEQERIADRNAIQHMAERFSTEIRKLAEVVAKL